MGVTHSAADMIPPFSRASSRAVSRNIQFLWRIVCYQLCAVCPAATRLTAGLEVLIPLFSENLDFCNLSRISLSLPMPTSLTLAGWGVTHALSLWTMPRDFLFLLSSTHVVGAVDVTSMDLRRRYQLDGRHNCVMPVVHYLCRPWTT